MVKEIIKLIKLDLIELGYKKKGNDFWKIRNKDFYNIINFQKGAYGDYFFINFGVRPLEIPECIHGKVNIPDRPKEYECTIVERESYFLKKMRGKGILESAIYNDKDIYSFGNASSNEIKDVLILCIKNEVEPWMKNWSSYEALLKKEIKPGPWETKNNLLHLFCYIKLRNIEKATEYLNKFIESQKEKKNKFSDLNDYMKKLIEELQ